MAGLTDREAAELLGLDSGVLPTWTQGILITDGLLSDNPIIYANRGFERLTGYACKEIVGCNCRFLQGRDTAAKTVAAIRRAIKAHQRFDGDILNYRRDGTPFWNCLSLSPLKTPLRQGLFVGLQFDVSFRHQDCG